MTTAIKYTRSFHPKEYLKICPAFTIVAFYWASCSLHISKKVTKSADFHI